MGAIFNNSRNKRRHTTSLRELTRVSHFENGSRMHPTMSVAHSSNSLTMRTGPELVVNANNVKHPKEHIREAPMKQPACLHLKYPKP